MCPILSFMRLFELQIVVLPTAVLLLRHLIRTGCLATISTFPQNWDLYALQIGSIVSSLLVFIVSERKLIALHGLFNIGFLLY